MPYKLSWQPTKHGVCDYHCKDRSSKTPPVSSEKTHKRLDTIRKKLIIKSQVKLVVVQNLKRENYVIRIYSMSTDRDLFKDKIWSKSSKKTSPPPFRTLMWSDWFPINFWCLLYHQPVYLRSTAALLLMPWCTRTCSNAITFIKGVQLIANGWEVILGRN